MTRLKGCLPMEALAGHVLRCGICGKYTGRASGSATAILRSENIFSALKTRNK